MKTAILSLLLSTAALAQTCDYYPLNTCAQNVLGKKTFLDGIDVPGGITTDGGNIVNGNLTVNGDAGIAGNVSIGGALTAKDAGFRNITAVDAGFTNATISTLTATSIPGFAQKIVWSTPDPLSSNASDQPTRPLNGALNGVTGSVAGVNCVPSMRGDGGGDIYVTLLDVTDGGTGNLLCSMDFDKCDLTANLVGTLGLAVETNGACNGIQLTSSGKYMYRLGVAIDGGATCGLHAPIMECTTVINPP